MTYFRVEILQMVSDSLHAKLYTEAKGISNEEVNSNDNTKNIEGRQ